MTESGLLCDSDAYYSNAKLYARFAECEDAPGFITKFLAEKVIGKRVLDFGCGTGKYASLLCEKSSFYYGCDRSPFQVELASSITAGNERVHIFESDGLNLPLKTASIDCVIASWVFGTILDEDARLRRIQECSRVLSENGEFFLIENDTGSEFEKIRGRYPFNENTSNYNNWLCKIAGFLEFKKIQTYFEFKSVNEAKNIFGEIWGKAAKDKISSNRIEHTIIIFYKGYNHL